MLIGTAVCGPAKAGHYEAVETALADYQRRSVVSHSSGPAARFFANSTTTMTNAMITTTSGTSSKTSTDRRRQGTRNRWFSWQMNSMSSPSTMTY